MKKNTLYKRLYNSYVTLVFSFVLVILILFSIVFDILIVNNNKMVVLSSAEKSSDNISYALQQEINLAYSIAENETLKHNVKAFSDASQFNKIDYDFELTKLLEGYWSSHIDIAKIRIFLPRSAHSENISYKSIYYLSEFNSDEWSKYFQNGSSAIISEYSASANLYHSFKKDTSKMAVIVPILYGQSTIGFLNMDIDKNALFSRFISNNLYIVLDNNGKIIYDNTGFDKQLFENKIAGISKDRHSLSIRYEGRRYLVSITSNMVQGFRIIQFSDYKMLTTHRVIIIFICCLLFIITLLFAVYYSLKKTKEFSAPLNKLSEAMQKSVHIENETSLPDEVSNLYESYNRLLSDNSKMLDDVIKSREEKYSAELKSLLAQISPHFLFNTLNVVVWKAIRSNQEDIANIINNLAKLCKITYNVDSDYTDLETELKHIEFYMQLQVECFKNEFDFSIDVPKELLSCKIPRFILQPLVENSIVHGFSQIVTTGHISVTADADEDLLILITDNGTGINEEALSKLNSGTYLTEKYGVRNINQRIKMIYGDEYGISYESNGVNKTITKILLPISF